MVQHAQDSTNILKDFESLKNVVELINQFSEVAGPKLNIINLNAYFQVLEKSCEISPSLKIIQQINRLIFNFLWSKNRIKRKTLIGKENKVGINIIDFESKLKDSWV